MDLDVHVVSHTHWDREWYEPLERFRQRLVALVDELLDSSATGETFLLDGQAIVIEDYLAVRPERTALVGEALRSGRLEAGPWYVLGDELIPSGEAMIRNLLTGRRILRRFGAESPPVLYCPDSFGHPASLPALASGFGLPLIILWRGYGGRRAPPGDTARWIGPGGDEALLFHLPRDGYEYGSHLPRDVAGAAARWARMRGELAPWSATGALLIPNGADHHARQVGYEQAITALEQAGAGDHVHRSSLAGFARAVVERARGVELPIVAGELRDSYGYTWTLQGTFATRAHEKRLNARTERLLLREAEPFAALAARTGSTAQPLLDAAWSTLLAAHPHDTLCGCSIDEVAQAMELRLRSASNQARGIARDAVFALLGHDPVAAREQHEQWRPVVIVQNPVPRPRGGVAIVEIEEFLQDVPVGPGSAPRDSTISNAPRNRPKIPGLGPVQVLSRAVRNSRTESARHYPDNDLVTMTEVAAWVPPVPAYGLSPYALEGAKTPRRAPVDKVIVGTHWMENRRMTVGVTGMGQVSLEHSGRKRRIESLFHFVDESDVGDLYTPAVRPRPFVVQCRGVRRAHRGPLRGQLTVIYEISEATGGSRSRIADIVVHLVLDAEAEFLRVRISGTNRKPDHRLRIVFNSDLAGGEIWADAAFGPIRRDAIIVTDADRAMETPPPTAPLHRYVSRFLGAEGVTVYSDGLAEYEALSDGALAVTLVRAVGELSRNDLPERPGHAGWPTPTPLAQCVGPFEAEFGLLLHGHRWAATLEMIERTADDVLVPLTGSTLRSALSIPAPVEGVELIGTGLGFSAMKRSEDGERLVLRCVNLSDTATHGAWKLPFDVTEAQLARLDETPMSILSCVDNTIDFSAPPHGVVTVLVR